MLKILWLWKVLKRLLKYGKPFRKSFILAIIMLFIASLAEVIGPVIISYLIDHVIYRRYLSFNLINSLIISYIFLQMLSAILHYQQTIIFNKISINIIQQLRCDVMYSVLKQPLCSFDNRPIGQIISRITNDTEVIKDLYVTLITTSLRSATLIIAMLIMMFSLNWHMALLSTVIFPIVCILMLIYQYYSTPVTRKLRNYVAELNTIFNEIINGIKVIQQFSQQKRFGQHISYINRLHYLSRMKNLRLDSILLRPLLSLLFSIIFCSLILLFSFFRANVFAVGVLYAFISYLGRLNEPLIELTSQQSLLQQAIISGERIFELIDAKQEKYGHDNRPLNSGNIIIKNVNFSYNKNLNILNNINLEIPSLNCIALVGKTGSGKSTLAHLLMGYYQITQGEILIDQRSIKQLTHQVIRNGIAMVQQDPIILADTLFANIKLGRSISEKQVWETLEKVQLAELVSSLPGGIHVNLGEQGNNLSIGQKQLLALARVMVHLPKILILDEATSNIDSHTEQAIQKSLDIIKKHTTLLIIAHRLSTIITADNILVLDKGFIVEQGTHAQLLLKKGQYWKMYQSQKTTNYDIFNKYL